MSSVWAVSVVSVVSAVSAVLVSASGQYSGQQSFQQNLPELTRSSVPTGGKKDLNKEDRVGLEGTPDQFEEGLRWPDASGSDVAERVAMDVTLSADLGENIAIGGISPAGFAENTPLEVVFPIVAEAASLAEYVEAAPLTDHAEATSLGDIAGVAPSANTGVASPAVAEDAVAGVISPAVIIEVASSTDSVDSINPPGMVEPQVVSDCLSADRREKVRSDGVGVPHVPEQKGGGGGPGQYEALGGGRTFRHRCYGTLFHQ